MTKKTVRASEELLGLLHEAVGKHLLTRILSGEAAPAEVAQAIKFLKDNNIESVIEEGDTMHKLWASLPKFDDEEEYAN